MDKPEFRQQRRALIQSVAAWDRKTQRAISALVAHRLAQPTAPSVATDTNEWSDYLYDLAQWEVIDKTLEERRDSYIRSRAIAQKRLDSFRPVFAREEDPGD